MPLYDFECSKCGHKFEQIVKPECAGMFCPLCKIGIAKKILTTCNFKLKGGGWARDGYTQPDPEKMPKK